MSKFINRTNELSFLNKEYAKLHSSLVVIYGRRRIGKTALIRKFIEDKSAIYFLATEEPEKENIKCFQGLLSDFFDNPLLNANVSFSWKDLFSMFKVNNDGKKQIIVIDEFQYLGKVNKAFPSVFQNIWDSILKDSNVMVILCGSLISIMEEQTLSYSSPLYGRRTGQIKMKSINFLHYKEFFKDKTTDELIQYYAVTGGVPKYIEMFKTGDDLFSSIKENILDRQSFLYEEPVFLLEKEVSDLGTYFSIIKTIAAGNHKLGKIATALSVNQSNLSKYINTLINLDILERQIPVTEENPEKSKKGLYYIKDNFLEFWFKFVYPYRSYLELDNIDFVMSKIQKNFIDNHVSFVFENICSDFIWNLAKEDKLPFMPMKVGKYWDSSDEIDVVAINPDSADILFGECKYLNTKVGSDLYFKLKEKSKKVTWKKDTRTDYFILFSRNGFTDDLNTIAENDKNLILVDFLEL